MIGDKHYTEALDVFAPRGVGVVEERSHSVEAGPARAAWSGEK